MTNIQFIVILCLFAILAIFNLFSFFKSKKKDKNGARYSKKIVAICLTVMTAMLAADIVLCWRSGEQLDSQSVTAIAAFGGRKYSRLHGYGRQKLNKKPLKNQRKSTHKLSS